MPGSVTIHRPEGPPGGRITLPPAKSLANRALVLASLAGDPSTVVNGGTADDVRILRQLLLDRPRRMHCGDGGTTFRFLLAWACVQEGEEHLITGNARLLQRPHGPLVDALRVLGADISETAAGLIVHGRRMKGGSIALHSPESSQFISALLLVAPCFAEGLHLRWTGTRLSEPYVQMTLRLLAQFGAVVRADAQGIHVSPGALAAVPFQVPGDWSAAAFWYQVAALAPGSRMQLTGLVADGLQGDEAVADLFKEHVASKATDEGIVLRPEHQAATATFIADLTGTPDLFQPLAFAMAALGRRAEFTGLHNLPLKETDRLKAVAGALHVLNIHTEYRGGRFFILPQGPFRETAEGVEQKTTEGAEQEAAEGATLPPFDPQGDHRMAMALAPLALAYGAITILHPEVVNKSYPGYWEALKNAGFVIQGA